MDAINKLCILLFILCTLLSCSNDSEEKVPTADLTQMNFRYEPGAGEIKLMWDMPEGDPGFYYMKINYYDPKEKKDKMVVVSSYASFIIIDNTRARYNGQYKFTLTPYSVTDTPGQAYTLEAESGPAPKTTTVTLEEIPLSASSFYGNATAVDYPLDNLCNDNYADLYHTDWKNPNIASYHYIDIDLGQDVEYFKLHTWNRSSNAGDCPGTVRLYRINQLNDPNVNMDAPMYEYTHPKTGNGEEATIMYPSQDDSALNPPVRYLRYCSIVSAAGHKFWNLAEIKINKVIVSVYDPEVDEVSN